MRFHLREGISKKLFYAPKKIKLLTLLITTYYLGWAIIEPFFPIYLKQIFGNYSNVGIVMSSVYLFTIITSLFFGQFINRVSKKIMILLSLLFYIPSSFILISINRLSHFILFQAYHSVVRSPLWISSEAYIRKNVPRKKASEAMGTFYSGYGLALVFGPIIGALLIYKIGFLILYSISLFAFFAFIISFFIPRSNKGSIMKGIGDTITKDGFIIKEFRDFLKNKCLENFIIFIFLFYFSIYPLFMIIPLFLRELNVSYINIGIIYSLFFIPLVFESIFSKIKNKKLAVLSSLFLGSIVLFSIYFVKDLTIIFFLTFFMGVLFSIMNPILKGQITYFMPKKDLGELGGIEYSVINLAAFLSFFFAGFISDIYGINTMFLISSIILFILFLFSFKNKLFSN
jgi:MFS family permease